MVGVYPYRDRLVYLIQTKLQMELPKDIVWDIESTLYNYGKKCCEVCEKEKDYWREKALTK